MKIEYLSTLFEILEAYCLLIGSGYAKQAFHFQSGNAIFRRIGGIA